MKAEDIKTHFETSGKNVVFVFEENPFAQDEIRQFGLGWECEIAEYKGDAVALK